MAGKWQCEQGTAGVGLLPGVVESLLGGSTGTQGPQELTASGIKNNSNRPTIMEKTESVSTNAFFLHNHLSKIKKKARIRSSLWRIFLQFLARKAQTHINTLNWSQNGQRTHSTGREDVNALRHGHSPVGWFLWPHLLHTQKLALTERKGHYGRVLELRTDIIVKKHLSFWVFEHQKSKSWEIQAYQVYALFNILKWMYVGPCRAIYICSPKLRLRAQCGSRNNQEWPGWAMGGLVDGRGFADRT